MSKPFVLSMIDDKVKLTKVLHDVCDLGFTLKAIGFNDDVEKLKLDGDYVIQEGPEVGEKAPTKEGAYKNLLKMLSAKAPDRENYFIRGTVIITPYSLRPVRYEAWIRLGRYFKQEAGE